MADDNLPGYNASGHSDRQNEAMRQWQENKLTPEQKQGRDARRVYDDLQFALKRITQLQVEVDAINRRLDGASATGTASCVGDAVQLKFTFKI